MAKDKAEAGAWQYPGAEGINNTGRCRYTRAAVKAALEGHATRQGSDMTPGKNEKPNKENYLLQKRTNKKN